MYEWSFSAQAQYTMTGIAKVCAALFGTSGTVNGLACTPTGPATMAVQIGPGEVYQIEPLEATACGTLPQNTTNSILKQGIQLGTFTTSTFATPVTTGQSINYLIEAQYQDQDISLDPTSGASPVVLQFFNSANPASPWSGPNNSGSTSNTFRDGIVAYQIKAGVAATTGTQVTPSPDTGWIGLWVVTVPFGASSLTSGNIAQYAAAPILPTGILQSILTSNLTYGIDNGTANVIQATFPIPVTTLTDGMTVWVKVKNANTGATTFTPNPGVISASPVVGAAHAALQGGEYVANGRAQHVWRQDISSWVLVECTGAAVQIAPATQSQHAVQLGQNTGVVGVTRNLKAYLGTAGTSLTFTADEIGIKGALGGQSQLWTNANSSVSTSTTNAIGGIVGTALAASGFAGIYAAYNPSTQAFGLYGKNANSLLANVDTSLTGWLGVLISVWPLNASTQFGQAIQVDRQISRIGVQVLSTSSGTGATWTLLTISGAVPANAKIIHGTFSCSTNATAAANTTVFVAADVNGIGAQQVFLGGTSASGSNVGASFTSLPIATAQTMYYQAINTAGSPSFTISVNGYNI